MVRVLRSLRRPDRLEQPRARGRIEGGQGELPMLGQKLGLKLEASIHRVAVGEDPTPDGLALFATGQPQIMDRLARLERQTRRSVWSTNPQRRFDPEDPADALDERSLARGLDFQEITTARAVRFHPLLTSMAPWTRVGPAPYKCLIVDRRVAILAGPPTPSGDPRAYIATAGPMLTSALDLWEISFVESRPLLPADKAPPLNRRQLQVARALCLGQTDASIAHSLGVSPRTVARDVTEIFAVTDARSRSDAVLAMLGRGRQCSA